MRRIQMPYSKEQRIQIFAEEIVKGTSQSDAYRKAYPNCKKWKAATVWNEASKFAASHEVSTRVNELKQQARKLFDCEITEILEGYYNIAMNDPAEMYDENGHIKPIHEIPEHIRKTMDGIEHGTINHVEYVDGAEVVTPMTYIQKYKLESRVNALNKLLEYKQGELASPPEGKERSEVDIKQLARRILKLVHDATEHSNNQKDQ